MKKEFNAVGIIKRINDDELGNVWFYVDININGIVYSAQTDKYRSIPVNTAIGDYVQVVYRFIDEKMIRCYIVQSGFERIIRDDVKINPLVIIGGLLSFLIIVLLLIIDAIWGL